MRVSTYILLEELKNLKPRTYKAKDQKFENFKILNEDPLIEDTLYICDVTKYVSLSENNPKSTFILIDPHKILEEFDSSELNNLIVLNENITFDELINIISDIFKKYNDIGNSLIKMLYMGYNIETILVNICNSVQLELNLNSSKGTVLFRNSKSYKYYPQRSLTSYNIREDKKLLGSLSLMENQNLSKDFQLSVFPMICEIIDSKLLEYFNKKEEAFYALSRKVLDSISNDKKFDEDGSYPYLQTIGWSLEDKYKILLIVSSKYDAIQPITEFINEKYPKDSLIIKQDTKYLVIINTKKINTSVFISEIKLRVEDIKNDIKIISSTIFTGLSSIREQYYFLHDLANKIDNENFLDMTSDTIKVIYLLSKDFNTKVFINPAVEKLAEHDMDNDGDLLETLYTYISHERSLVNAADALNVHRNTIVYRVNKINEIININLDDPNVRYHMLISIVLLKGDSIL